MHSHEIRHRNGHDEGFDIHGSAAEYWIPIFGISDREKNFRAEKYQPRPGRLSLLRASPDSEQQLTQHVSRISHRKQGFGSAGKAAFQETDSRRVLEDRRFYEESGGERVQI